ncbi:MAG: hypothetical protein NTY65_09595 [Planctomycetota bacterium]|nr:hypothetical protein [Planctomycetota bacterium]
MRETSAAEVPPQPSGPALGVIEAMRMGWRLLMSDFWMLWLLALVLFAVLMGVGLVSCCLLCLAPLVMFFVHPPLEAGLFKALKGRIDGDAVNFNDLFAAFPECYWQAVLAGLPAMAIDGAMQVVQFPVRIAFQFAEPLSRELHYPAEVLIPVIIGAGAVVLLIFVALLIFRLFFAFSMLAIWDRKESGIEAIKTSMRLVKDHFWSILGLSLLFVLIGIAAAIVGLLACLVGMAITIPAVRVWHQITLVYLYRSWTGQPLVQPLPGAAMPDAPAPPVV